MIGSSDGESDGSFRVSEDEKVILRYYKEPRHQLVLKVLFSRFTEGGVEL